jgi:hypothetical protein
MKELSPEAYAAWAALHLMDWAEELKTLRAEHDRLLAENIELRDKVYDLQRLLDIMN